MPLQGYKGTIIHRDSGFFVEYWWGGDMGRQERYYYWANGHNGGSSVHLAYRFLFGSKNRKGGRVGSSAAPVGSRDHPDGSQ